MEKFEVVELGEGNSAEITLFFPRKSFYDSLEYYYYDHQEGWKSLPLEKDAVGSYLSFEISDGGIGDSDGEKQGTILHIGGLTAPTYLADHYTYRSCFIPL